MKPQGRLHADAIANSPVPRALEGEPPCEYAHRVGQWHLLRTQGCAGQVFTPIPTARFMAGLIPMNERSIRVLDPGIGTGILSCAVIEEFVKHEQASHLSLYAYETDPSNLATAETVLGHATKWAQDSDLDIEFHLFDRDFVLAGLDLLGVEGHLVPGVPVAYDAIIMNPPYFKLNASDPRVLATVKLAGRQTNIYSLFLSVAAQLLGPSGVLVSINPRSFASGQYFQAFRQSFFHRVRPTSIHLFDSRKGLFPGADTLQETMILAVQIRSNADARNTVSITASEGLDDIDEPRHVEVPLTDILLPKPERRLIIPTSDEDCRVLRVVRAWTTTLPQLDLKISTGPVVPFRTKEILLKEDASEMGRVLPLLWMNNLSQMRVEWPLRNHKPEFILDVPQSSRLLVPNERFVLLRRFSAKEERKRLVAAVVPDAMMTTARIGIENHVNFIHRGMHGLERNLALGLALLLNSSTMDRYFRILNGNTQVNAYDLRSIPLPDRSIIEEMGRRYAEKEVASCSEQNAADFIVEDLIAVPPA